MKTVIIILLVAFSTKAFSQRDTLPSFVKDSIDRYVQLGMDQWQIPGIAVCIIKDGRVVLMQGYGVKEKNGTDKVDEHTLFMIGSNTKAFTATAMAMLETDSLVARKGGKFSLNDKVTTWLPQFKLQNKAAGEQAIIKDLLCHRLGFETFQGDFTYWTSNLSRHEVIEKMGHIKANYPFRTTWGYTNAGFVVAGEIIKTATGMPWEKYLEERIFVPLGMRNTLALSKDFPRAVNRCSAHTMADGAVKKIPFCLIDNLAAAGSIGSSVNDMSHWVIAQLNNGRYNDKQVIAATAIGKTRFPNSILGNGNHLYNTGHFNLYGLGWFLEEYCGRKIISHTGGVNGFVTSVTLIPEENLGILVFTNTDHNNFFEALKWEIADAYLGKPFRDYNKAYLGFYNSQTKENDAKEKTYKDSVSMQLKTSLPLSNYAGNYSNEVYGNINVKQEGIGLRMNFSHHPAMHATLFPIGGNRFYATFSDPIFGKAVFPFIVKDSKVASVLVKVADFVEYAPYQFDKVK